MNVSKGARNVLLVLLALVTVIACAYAVWNVQRPHPSAEDGWGPTRDEVATDVATPTMPPTVGDHEVTLTPATPKESQTAEPPGALVPDPDPPVSVESWFTAWQVEDSHLLVIGDGFSNLPWQWVQLWGEIVGRERPVQIHHWGETADATFNEAILLSDVEGPALTIWSASRAGTTIDAARARVSEFFTEAGEVDAVLVSLGLHSEDEDVAAALDDLLTAMDDDLPVLVTVAPRGLMSSSVSTAVADWASDNADRVSMIDLRGRARDEATAEEWAIAFAELVASTTPSP